MKPRNMPTGEYPLMKLPHHGFGTAELIVIVDIGDFHWRSFDEVGFGKGFRIKN